MMNIWSFAVIIELGRLKSGAKVRGKGRIEKQAQMRLDTNDNSMLVEKPAIF
jgi:hypothetical protein